MLCLEKMDNSMKSITYEIKPSKSRSVSECEEAQRIGYDTRQINRIVIRMANFFLDQDMQVIFGHDWREDGVMRAIANFLTSTV